jgi:branched-chain amino acid transport system substrate-binding protein
MKKLFHLIACGFMLLAGAASARDLVVAQIVPLSGPVGGPGSQFAAGASLYFDHVNATGGVRGKKIQHLKLDDKYDVAESLVRLPEVLSAQESPAVLMTFGTASSLAISQELDKRGVRMPVFPTGSGSTTLREPFNRNLFHIRASYSAEFSKLIQVLSTTGQKSFAVVYQDDAFGQDSLTAIRKTLASLNLPAPPVFKHDRTQKDISSLVKQVAETQSQVVLLATTPGPAASFVKGAHAQKLNKTLATISDTDPNDLVGAVGVEAARGVMFSQALPNPQNVSHPMVAQYARLIQESGGKVPRNAATLEGYIQARVIVEALRRSANSSGPALIKQLEAIRQLNLGDYFINFSQTSHEGAAFVDTAIVSATGSVRR